MSLPCAACGAETREGARFCGACGAPLVLECPECRSPARIAEDIGNPAIHVTALGAVGVAEIALGRAGDAVSSLETALTYARDLGVALFEEPTLLIHLARARLEAGDGGGAARAADEAVTVARRQGASVVECLALITRARVGRALGAAHPTAEADLDAALHLAREAGATAYEREIEAAKQL